jgi:hypothetical protein
MLVPPSDFVRGRGLSASLEMQDPGEASSRLAWWYDVKLPRLTGRLTFRLVGMLREEKYDASSSELSHCWVSTLRFEFRLGTWGTDNEARFWSRDMLGGAGADLFRDALLDFFAVFLYRGTEGGEATSSSGSSSWPRAAVFFDLG